MGEAVCGGTESEVVFGVVSLSEMAIRTAAARLPVVDSHLWWTADAAEEGVGEGHTKI